LGKEKDLLVPRTNCTVHVTFDDLWVSGDLLVPLAAGETPVE